MAHRLDPAWTLLDYEWIGLDMSGAETLLQGRLEYVKERLDLIINWLLSSGIQGAPGYFHCWYDMTTGGYPFVYTEMIGHGISTLLYLYEREGDRALLDRGIRAGDWLLDNVVSEDGAFVWKYYLEHGEQDRAQYAFDNSVCISALVDLSRIVGRKRYLDAAIRAGEWLLNWMGESNGLFKARYDPETGSFGGSRWSCNPGSYQSKIGISLLKLAGIVDGMEDRARRLCEWVLNLQESDGRFRTNPGSRNTYVHAHCYAAEGLLYTGRKVSEPRFSEAAHEASKWLRTIQKPGGAVGRWYGPEDWLSIDDNTEALAQAVRLWLIYGGQYRDESNVFGSQIERAVDRLLSLQCLDNDPRAYGGLHYAVLDGNLVPHINCCASLFAIQALQMYLDWRKGLFSSELALEELI